MKYKTYYITFYGIKINSQIYPHSLKLTDDDVDLLKILTADASMHRSQQLTDVLSVAGHCGP